MAFSSAAYGGDYLAVCKGGTAFPSPPPQLSWTWTSALNELHQNSPLPRSSRLLQSADSRLVLPAPGGTCD
eukprot:scaffold93173_cov80-Phaeocystis_antarctica.AAC.1